MNAVCVEQSNVRVQCDTTYRQIFNGQNVIFACRRQANDALLHYPSSIAAADVLIKTRIEEIKYLSTKDRQNVERRQLMMVVSLAMIANNDPYSEMVKAALLRAQRKAQIGSCLYKLVYTVFTGLSQKGIHNIPNASLKKLNHITGSPLISKMEVNRPSVSPKLLILPAMHCWLKSMHPLPSGLLTKPCVSSFQRSQCPNANTSSMVLPSNHRLFFYHFTIRIIIFFYSS